MPSRSDASVEQPGTPPVQRTGSGWERYFSDRLSRGKAALGRLIPAVPPCWTERFSYEVCSNPPSTPCSQGKPRAAIGVAQ